MRAAFVVGMLAFAGAVPQGAAIARTIGEELIEGATLSPLTAVVALLIASVYIAGGVFYGMPMSFNQLFVSAIAATGYAVGSKAVSERKLAITALVWVDSIAFGLAVGYGVYAGVSHVTGSV